MRRSDGFVEPPPPSLWGVVAPEHVAFADSASCGTPTAASLSAFAW